MDRQQELITSKKWRKTLKDLQDEKKAHEKDNRDNATTIKTQDDTINTQISYIHELETKLQAREEQESYIICKNEQGYITDIKHTSAFNERIEYDESIDINVVNSKAYQQSPFLKPIGNKIIKVKEAYNKYLIIGGIL